MPHSAPPTRAFAASDRLSAELERFLPHGVSSGIRQRTQRVIFDHGRGGTLTDVDGNTYVDCVMALGPIVIGHSEPILIEALHAQVDRLLVSGAESADAASFARRVTEWVPNAEALLFANTGSEAVHLALRIARATTERPKILRFDGHYHGWIDPAYTNGMGHTAPKGASPIPVIPNGPGQRDAAEDVVVARWNDVESFDDAVAVHGAEIAAVIMEPVAFNAGGLRAHDGFIEHVREVCTARGMLLIFDEVVTGFRLGKGGAQSLLGITPDLATFAKAVAPGVPMAMVTGTRAAMAAVIDGRLGGLGTYTGNPLAMALAEASTAFIDATPDFYEVLDSKGQRLETLLAEVIAESGLPLSLNRTGSVLHLFWNAADDRSTVDAISTGDPVKVAAIIDRMLHHGVFALPRGAFFLCYRHTEADLAQIADAMRTAISELAVELAR